MLLLAVLWGGTFMFLRPTSPLFGQLLLIDLRILIASLFLLPVPFRHGCHRELRDNWRQIALLYGISANRITHNMQGVSGLAITTGSLVFSALFLLPVVL